MDRHVGEHIKVAAIITDKAGCRCCDGHMSAHWKYEIELPAMRYGNMATRLWVCGMDLGRTWDEILLSRSS